MVKYSSWVGIFADIFGGATRIYGVSLTVGTAPGQYLGFAENIVRNERSLKNRQSQLSHVVKVHKPTERKVFSN